VPSIRVLANAEEHKLIHLTTEKRRRRTA
jgi:hypothetical protein